MDLTLTLDVQIEKSTEDEDVSVKLRHHGVTKKLTIVMDQFKSDRNIIERCVRIYSNLTMHDPGTVDCLFEENIAPYVLDALKCFPRSQTMQLHGSKVLRRLYELSRRKALLGRRHVLLGK